MTQPALCPSCQCARGHYAWCPSAPGPRAPNPRQDLEGAVDVLGKLARAFFGDPPPPVKEERKIRAVPTPVASASGEICATCGAKAGDPLAKRMLTRADKSVTPCPSCLEIRS